MTDATLASIVKSSPPKQISFKSELAKKIMVRYLKVAPLPYKHGPTKTHYL
jgi:hypothetical protein